MLKTMPDTKQSKAGLLKEKFYPESQFSGITSVDGTVLFYSQVHGIARPDSVVLDIGCGRGRFDEDPVPFRRELRILKGKVKRVIGIDVDEAGYQNPHLDDFRKIENDVWPIEDGSIDVAVCDFVLEHIADPEGFFREASRVLAPGGVFCARTPNAMGYVALISRMIPDRFHAKVVSKVQENRKEEDVFPTYYRCNSRSKLRRLFKKCGLTGTALTTTAEPSYLYFSKLAYFLGVVHQKLSPPFFGQAILAFARKDSP